MMYFPLTLKRAIVELVSRPLANLGDILIATLTLTAIPLMLYGLTPWLGITWSFLMMAYYAELYELDKDTAEFEVNYSATVLLALLASCLSASLFGAATLVHLATSTLGLAQISPGFIISLSIGTNILFVCHRALTQSLSLIQNFINIPLFALARNARITDDTGWAVVTKQPVPSDNRFQRLVGIESLETGRLHSYCINIDRLLTPLRWMQPEEKELMTKVSPIRVIHAPNLTLAIMR